MRAFVSRDTVHPAAEPGVSLNRSEPVPDRLTMPMPDRPFLRCACVRAAGWRNGPANVRPSTPDEDSLAWYRWMIGHHVSFAVWRLMCGYLESAAIHGRSALRMLDAMFDSYSALLLYAGSCSTSTYGRVIRPRMTRAHPAFSGMWARDYERVRLLSGSIRSRHGSPVTAAVRTNRLVHATIARMLVPHGGSLLRDSGRDVHRSPTDHERDLLDAFFLTDRGDMCWHSFARQLEIRVEQILNDIAVNPVVPRYGSPVVDGMCGQIPRCLEHLLRLSRVELDPHSPTPAIGIPPR
jgi:hypothetical protein